jgi:ribosomal protein S4
MVDLCEYFDKKKNFENKEKTTVGFRDNKKKFRRSYSKRLLNFKDPDFVGIVEKVTNKLFFESPKINRFTFVNSGVGYILRYFFVPKPEFSKLKDLLRNCFYKKLAESPKRRSAAYHRRIFYRKRNNVTVCFKKYFIKPQLSVVFTEHAIKNTFAFIVRRRKLKQTFYKKIIIKKYLSKYYNVKINYLRPIQKKLNRLNLFVSYLENRLDFFLVKAGFFKNVNTARLYISKGFIILNFRVCTTPLRVVKV